MYGVWRQQQERAETYFREVFWENVLLDQQVEQISSAAVVEDEVQVVRVLEGVVQLDDPRRVGVAARCGCGEELEKDRSDKEVSQGVEERKNNRGRRRTSRSDRTWPSCPLRIMSFLRSCFIAYSEPVSFSLTSETTPNAPAADKQWQTLSAHDHDPIGVHAFWETHHAQ